MDGFVAVVVDIVVIAMYGITWPSLLLLMLFALISMILITSPYSFHLDHIVCSVSSRTDSGNCLGIHS